MNFSRLALQQRHTFSAIRGYSTLKVFNPTTQKLIAEVPEDTPSSIAQKVETARKAHQKWYENTTIESRIATIQKFSQSLQDDIDLLAKTVTDEMGKPIKQAKGEISATRNRISFFCERAPRLLESEVVSKEPVSEIVVKEPLGLIANISAWNYPYFVSSNVFIPALIAGNAVIYKPSEFATLTAQHIEKRLHAAGIPKEIFQTVVGSGSSIGSAFMKERYDGVFFTGSVPTGKQIYLAAAQNMTPVVQLELGGKDPFYVSPDVDAQWAAESLGDGAMYNTGQGCCSVERIYVHKDIAPQFIKHLVNFVRGLKMGDPHHEDTYIGPITRPAQLEFLKFQVQDAVNKGAKLEVGGSIDKSFFQPTVLTNCNHTMSVMKDESFGPIVGVQVVGSEEEAISLMKDTEFGLTSGVYTSSAAKARQILSQIPSGTAYMNCCDRVPPGLPWSGRKNSGIGATLGAQGITCFVRPRSFQFAAGKSA